MGSKLGDSGGVTGYQVDKFVLTPGQQGTWLFYHTFPLRFIGKVSALAQFKIKPAFKGYSFLDQATKEFEHALDFILIDCINKQELNVSFD